MDFLDEIDTIFCGLKKYPSNQLAKLDHHCIDMLHRLQDHPDDDAINYWTALSVMVKSVLKQTNKVAEGGQSI